MGFDVERFESCQVDGELICSICNGVLQNPLQVNRCEHAFCRDCIMQWLQQNATCPHDRQPIAQQDLKPVPRILKNLLAKLVIACEFTQFGCTTRTSLDQIDTHQRDCDANPQRPVACGLGCGLVIPKDQLPDHNCVRSLHTLVRHQADQLEALRVQLNQQTLHVDDLQRQMRLVRECIKIIQHKEPRIREMQIQMENEDLTRWVNQLAMARVTRWGGMISTPDSVLQSVVKRALVDSGCPPSIVHELMQNAHERRWPPGLATLETRQLNRQRYHAYTIRRIPDRQAVLVMHCENRHMPDDMIVTPGLVMIFAHGVE